ncbi:cell wall hydrolase [Croceibacterium aestuarii]|uniref:cell wall hydrolase n=1 Tax=Croceibacterium aestuarii TaxID=3064139 RepID=UPI00272E28B9|nr:cell wall hydrolase [Croceibacterium sp. D39]
MSARSPSWPPPELIARRRVRAERRLPGRLRAAWARSNTGLRLRFAALAAAIAFPAMAAPDAWQPDFAEPAVGQAAPMPFETPGESFPGSAFYYLDDSGYRPMPGEGDIHSDAAATTAAEAPRDSAGPAARALRAMGSASDAARAQKCLAMAIYYEAATEPDAGQRAVAQVVLNRVAHPSYPNTVCGVVFQGSERRTGCQFTFTCDGSLNRQPMAAFWDRASRVAHQALAGAVYAPVGLATHYHTLAVHPYWADSLQKVTTIGAHIFYRWRGAAGQSNAFTVAYRGGEPLAAPHPRVTEPVPAAEADPLVLARAFEQAHPAARQGPATQAQAPAATPDYAPAVSARGGEALFRGSNLPQGGELSPELERSGQWLR